VSALNDCLRNRIAVGRLVDTVMMLVGLGPRLVS
jgi:hypothetical protein